MNSYIKQYMYTTSNLRRLASFLLVVVFMFSSSSVQAFEGDAKNGKKLFKQNCASCHKLDKKLVGPALTGVTDKYSEEWLLQWIRNNAELRASGDKDAIDIFEEYNGSIMSSFTMLSNQDIFDILTYTVEGDQKPVLADAVSGTVVVAEAKDYSNQITIGLGLLLFVMVMLLARMKNTLRLVQGEETVSILDEAGWFWGRLIKNKRIVTLATVLVTIVFLNQLYALMMGVGQEQNYQPEQPIAFSHALHAGENEIDCNYCHSSARHSKHSGIPSANVCMNCHMYVDGSEITDDAGALKYDGENSPEIAKIYAAIGWDVEERGYIEDYEQQPIKWVRIHNLPDLAYFNHSQHVNAAELECQECHGPVETMEEVYQYSPLTMGWCINCHRETEVQFEQNGYYQDFHEELTEEYHGEKITAEKIGGIECGKCHY
ncbi:MAG: c-type cytochrome [Schleiferiaceae bacterium]|nr:c-type cytochrome [Schleiferiaceae bacterium]